MKRILATVSLVAAATTAAVPSTSPAPSGAAHKTAAAHAKPVKVAAAKCKVAPADEYFGKLKMSILGIRNTIKDQGLRVDVDPDKAPTTLNAIALTEDAMRDWQKKYPCDSWIPGTIYALEHFYLKIHTNDGVKHVHAAFAWLRHDYPKSRFVAVASRENGQATAVPAIATVSDSNAASLGPSPAPTASSSAAPAISPVGSVATPQPGTAPASVINAQNAMSKPTPAPHQ